VDFITPNLLVLTFRNSDRIIFTNVLKDESTSISHPKSSSQSVVHHFVIYNGELYILYKECISVFNIEKNEHRIVIDLPEEITTTKGAPVLIIGDTRMAVAISCFPQTIIALWNRRSENFEFDRTLSIAMGVGPQLNYAHCSFITKSMLLLGTGVSVQVWDINSEEIKFNEKPKSSTDIFVSVRYEHGKIVTQSFYTFNSWIRYGKEFEPLRSQCFEEKGIIITALSVHVTGYIIIGSHDGFIYIIDESGTIVQSTSVTEGETHEEKENQLSILPSTQFEKKINSIYCADDGKIYIGHEDNMISVWDFNSILLTITLVKSVHTVGSVYQFKNSNKKLNSLIVGEEYISIMDIEN